MAGLDDITAANQAFYDAIAGGDYPRLDELWAARGAMACLHPGWPPLLERGAIMKSWRRIFDTGSPAITCSDATVQRDGDRAIVTCYEHISGTVLVAANMLRLEDRAWRIFHHQAGPVAEAPTGNPSGSPDDSIN